MKHLSDDSHNLHERRGRPQAIGTIWRDNRIFDLGMPKGPATWGQSPPKSSLAIFAFKRQLGIRRVMQSQDKIDFNQ